MMKAERHTIKAFLALFIVFGTLVLMGCQKDNPAMTREEASRLTMADFYGDWYTTMPNGEMWQLVLAEDGHFEALPRRSTRGGAVGQWNVADGSIIWMYTGGAAIGGASKEINPIILKTEHKFMLSEKMGMTSVYSRSPR